MKKPVQPETLIVQDPDDQSIGDSYRRLPRIGRLVITVKLPKLTHTVHLLEQAGFCAIYINPFSYSDVNSHISAYKGKQGPCYETGRKAIYTGIAMAVFDDDNHLLLTNEEIPVCEKTATVYSFSPYHQLIYCTPVIPEDLEIVKQNPRLFNTDCLGENLDKLFNRLNKKKTENKRDFLYYPGPFKCLILQDGTIVRRGRVNNIPQSYRKTLIREDKLFPLNSHEKVDAAFFQIEYPKSGPGLLMETLSTDKDTHIETSEETDFICLDKIKTSLKNRLITTIEKNKKFFLLTGSEPEDRLGCCPSKEVEEANMLVRAGILSAMPHPVPEGTCPVTTYSFKGEMQIIGEQINFKIDQAFRDQVLHSILHKKKVSILEIIKWILIAFILISITLAVIRITGNSSDNSNQSLIERLAPASENQMMIVLFHFRKRCELCLKMEKITTEFLEELKRSQPGTPYIQFKRIIIDDKENLEMVKRFKIYTSTLVIVDFEKSEVRQFAVLDNAWKIVQDEMEFREMLKNELANFKLEFHE